MVKQQHAPWPGGLAWRHSVGECNHPWRLQSMTESPMCSIHGHVAVIKQTVSVRYIPAACVHSMLRCSACPAVHQVPQRKSTCAMYLPGIARQQPLQLRHVPQLCSCACAACKVELFQSLLCACADLVAGALLSVLAWLCSSSKCTGPRHALDARKTMHA